MGKLQYQTQIIYTGYSASPTDVSKRPGEPVTAPTPYPPHTDLYNKNTAYSVNSKNRTGYNLSETPGRHPSGMQPGSGYNRIIIPDNRNYTTT